MPFGDSIGSNWAWVIPAASALSFFLVALLGRYLPNQGSFISIIAITLGFVLFWYLLLDFLDTGVSSFAVNWIIVGDTALTWGVLVDSLSVTMVGLVTFIALIVQVYSLGYMKGDPRFGWYFASHSLFVAAMLALVLADNLLFLYIAWELVGLGSYLLIGFWYERPSAVEAAKKAFVTTRIGDVALLIGIIMLFKATGTFDISTIFHAAQYGGISQSTLNISVFLIFIGAMGKSAQFPFHVWLPDAMEGPTPVSALIHAATMVAAGVYLVARMLPIFELAPNILVVVASVGLFTFLFAGTLALVATDLKRVLAYSTVSHLGLMMLSLGAFGQAAAIFHLVVHGISKSLLFLGAGNIMHSLSQETDIRKMGGLRLRMPVTSITFIIGAVALAGIPPLSGFFSKDEILLSVVENLNPVFLLLALSVVILSSLYMARLVFLVFFGDLKADKENSHEAPFIMVAPLIVLAVLSLMFGCLAFNWTDSYKGIVHFIDPNQKFHLDILLSVVSGLLAILGLLIGWAVYSKQLVSSDRIVLRFRIVHKLISNKYYIDEIYQWVIDRVILKFSNLVANFDRIVVNDVGVDGSAWTIMLSALRIRYLQSGKLYNYGMGMVLGIVSLVLIWWIVLL